MLLTVRTRRHLPSGSPCNSGQIHHRASEPLKSIFLKLSSRFKDQRDTVATLNDYMYKILREDTPAAKDRSSHRKTAEAVAKYIEKRSDSKYTVVLVGSGSCGLDGQDSDIDLGVARIGEQLPPVDVSYRLQNDVGRGLTARSQHMTTQPVNMQDLSEKETVMRLLRITTSMQNDSMKLKQLLLRDNVRGPLITFQANDHNPVVDVTALSLNSHHNLRLVSAFEARQVDTRADGRIVPAARGFVPCGAHSISTMSAY